MAKQSRESIIAELDARKIGYSDDMNYGELSALLKNAQQAERPEEAVLAPNPEEPIDYSGILCGLSTIQNLHRRITILERKLNA